MIKVNGKEMQIENISLKQLLIDCNFDIDKIAVELNEEIISKDDFENIILKENDKLEVVSFVGGG